MTNKFGSSFVRFALEATDAKAKKDIYTPRMKDFKASDSEGSVDKNYIVSLGKRDTHTRMKISKSSERK